jgi:hypothetical protein
MAAGIRPRNRVPSRRISPEYGAWRNSIEQRAGPLSNVTAAKAVSGVRRASKESRESSHLWVPATTDVTVVRERAVAVVRLFPWWGTCEQLGAVFGAKACASQPEPDSATNANNLHSDNQRAHDAPFAFQENRVGSQPR